MSTTNEVIFINIEMPTYQLINQSGMVKRLGI